MNTKHRRAFGVLLSSVLGLGALQIPLYAQSQSVTYKTNLTANKETVKEGETEQTKTQFMDFFQPMPIVGKLRDDVWGAPDVGPRDQDNGLEDRDLSDYCYWDGTILKDEETGKYYMFASRWNQAGGHWGENGISGWQGSVAVYATSDNLYGPYEDQGMLWPDYYDGAGHNVFCFRLSEDDKLYKDGYRYGISVSDTGMHGDQMNGTFHVSKSLDGPWDHIGKMNIGSGNFGLSNISIMVRPDGRYEATNRNGDIATADSLAGPWNVHSNGLWWNTEGMPSTNIEDPVIWYSDGLYHIVANKWDARQAYYLTSEDGLSDWTLHNGAAYTPTKTFLSYEDGTMNHWQKLERPGLYIEDGKLKAMTLAVIDVEKEQDFGNDQHGSKIIVIPFDGEGLSEFARHDKYRDPMAGRMGIVPTEDAHIQSWQGEWYNNYGAESFMQMQYNGEQGTFGEGPQPYSDYDCKVAHAKYDLSTFDLSGADDIESATLSLVYQESKAGNADKSTVKVITSSSEWKEGRGYDGSNDTSAGALSWEHQPASYDGSVVAESESFPLNEGMKEVKVDVTEVIKAWMEKNPDEDIISLAFNETSGNRLIFGSKDGSLENRSPRLEVVKKGARVENITLDHETLNLKLGAAAALKATVAPANAAMKKVTWTSSKPDIVGVDENGNLETFKTGKAVITAETLDGRKTAECTVNVTMDEPSLLEAIDLSKATITSSGSYDNMDADKAFDGNSSTYWAAKRKDNAQNTFSVDVEFEKATTVGRVAFDEVGGNDGNRIAKLSVQTQNKNGEWETVQTFGGLRDDELNSVELSLDKTVNAKKVRLVFETLKNGNAFEEPNVAEIRLYQSANLNTRYYGITDHGVSLKWNTIDQAETYTVYGAKTGEEAKALKETTDTNITVDGLEAGSEYTLFVRAKLNSGESVDSKRMVIPTAKKAGRTTLESAQNANVKMPISSLAADMEYKGTITSDHDWSNWCVSPVKGEDGRYHIFHTRWKGDMSHWIDEGQIIHSVADTPEGPYEYVETVLSDPGQDITDTPDPSKVITDLPGHAPHNSRVAKIDDKYVLTFIVQTGDTSNVRGQKICLLTSDSVNGPWTWAGNENHYAVEASTEPGHWTYNSVLGVDNHDIIKIGDEYRIYFKSGVKQNDQMHYGYAYSKNLEGPYTLNDKPSISDNKGYLEDACVFEWNDTIYLLSTDNEGDNTGVGGYGILWKSRDNGETFLYDDAQVGFGLISDYITWPVTGMVPVHNRMPKFERPAILMEDGKPTYFMGTLGWNLDGDQYCQNFVLKLNLNLSDDTAIERVGKDSLNLEGGTKEAPAKGEATITGDVFDATMIRSESQQIRLYEDAAFTKETTSAALNKAKTTVYVKTVAETGKEAFFALDINRIAGPSTWDGITLSDSGNYGGFNDLPALIDGNLSTYWAGKRSSDSFKGDWTIDFTSEKTMNVSRIRMHELDGNDGNRITGVRVQTSENGEDWQEVDAFDGLKDNGSAMEEFTLTKPVSSKHIRMVIETAMRDENGTQRQAEPNICEVEFFNDKTEPEEPSTAVKSILDLVVKHALQIQSKIDLFQNKGLDVFNAELSKAQSVLNDSDDQTEIDGAAGSLNQSILELRLTPNEALLDEFLKAKN